MHLQKTGKVRTVIARVITTTRPLWAPVVRKVRETWRTANVICMYAFSVVCALSVPAFELMPFKYSIASLIGFTVCFSIFIRYTWMKDDEGH
jgi:hypothetical protein